MLYRVLRGCAISLAAVLLIPAGLPAASPPQGATAGNAEVQIDLQVFSRELEPGEIPRGLIRLEFSRPPVVGDVELFIALLPLGTDGKAEAIQNWQLSTATMGAVAPQLVPRVRAVVPDEDFVPLQSTRVIQEYGLGTAIVRRAPSRPGDYQLYVGVCDVTGTSKIVLSLAWTRVTVTDSPKRIIVRESEFAPNPPTKDNVSVLKLDFAVKGIPATVPNPGDPTLEVFVQRLDDPSEKTENPYRIGLRIYRDLVNQGGMATGTCNVRITPRMAKRYRLRYKVSCDGYVPAEGVFSYVVKGPPGGPAPQPVPRRFEWVRIDPPRLSRVAWDKDTATTRTVGTATGMSLQVTNPQGELTTDSAVHWNEPPAVIREGMRVRLQVFKARQTGIPVGGKWFILCDHQDWQGESFLATQEGKESVTFSATLRCPSAGDPPKEIVEMFRAEGGIWNYNTAVNVYWAYKARPVSGDPGGTLTPDELRDLDPPTPADVSGGATPGAGGAPGTGGATGGQTGTGGTTGQGPGAGIDYTVPPPKPPDGRAKPIAETMFGGLWKTTNGDWGDIRLVQKGDEVTGSYGGTESEPMGTLTGTVKGRVLELKWISRDGKIWGGAKFTLAPDGKSMQGQRNDWRSDDPDFGQYRWDAARVLE